jgi:hypothetical protein
MIVNSFRCLDMAYSPSRWARSQSAAAAMW